MSVEEIRQVVGQFVDAARRASQAGFDGVQIHAAHFFFLSRFASPAVNHRTDAYGGSPRNRARILLEILAGVRQAAPELHVSIKLNSNDFTPGGLDEAASLELARLLAAAGIDSIEVSGNGTSVPGIRPHQNEAYFAPFAARLAEVVATPVILVGGLRSRETMESVLAETKIAALSLSRPLLREPDLPELLRTGAAARNALEQDLATTRRLGIRALPAHLLQFGARTMFLHGLPLIRSSFGPLMHLPMVHCDPRQSPPPQKHYFNCLKIIH